MAKQYYLYILASKRNGKLYIGITNDLIRRINEHKTKMVKGFTKKYTITLSVYFEIFENINDAITREKRLKKWNRRWKIRLIEEMNPEWNDLYTDLF